MAPPASRLLKSGTKRRAAKTDRIAKRQPHRAARGARSCGPPVGLRYASSTSAPRGQSRYLRRIPPFICPIDFAAVPLPTDLRDGLVERLVCSSAPSDRPVPLLDSRVIGILALNRSFTAPIGSDYSTSARDPQTSARAYPCAIWAPRNSHSLRELSRANLGASEITASRSGSPAPPR